MFISDMSNVYLPMSMVLLLHQLTAPSVHSGMIIIVNCVHTVTMVTWKPPVVFPVLTTTQQSSKDPRAFMIVYSHLHQERCLIAVRKRCHSDAGGAFLL